MPRVLFFDDRYLHVISHARRAMGTAQLLPDTLYGDSSNEIFANIPNVIFSESLQCWLMLTYGMHLREFYDVIQIHKSLDGLHWDPYDTTDALQLKTRQYPNQLFELGQCGEFSVYQDPYAPEEEKFRLLAIRHHNGMKSEQLETCMFISADGLHWKDTNITWHPAPPDLGPLSIFFNSKRGTYVIATRPDMVDRRISFMETKDWKNFTLPELVLETDALDTPVCESYGITVLPYDNYYLGLYWLFHPNAEQIVGFPNGVSGKYFDGYVDAQMTCSENGWYFKRSLRQPVLPNGEPGKPDCGCIYPRWMRQDENGDILIYACVYPFEHGRWREFVHESGIHKSIAAYRIREDGFCFFENIGGEAFLGTRTVLYCSGEVDFNIKCPTGCFKVQITDKFGHVIDGYSFDECIPFVGDEVHHTPIWQNGKKMNDLVGRVIRIEMRFKTGRLYAIHGDLKLILHPEL